MQIRNLEILKLRFGDAPLQVCDVMMKDMTDSRRADQGIKNLNSEPLPIHATIISRLFWPATNPTSLVMPGKFRQYVSQILVVLAVN